MWNWWTLYWGCLPLDFSHLSKRKLAKYNNQIEFQNIFQQYFNLVLNQFEWEGLPKTCDALFLEKAFLLYGKAIMVYDNGYLTLAASSGANLNVYGYPLKGWGWGWNGYNKEFNVFVPGTEETAEAVIGWDNPTAYPMINYIFRAAKRLADLINSCDVAAQALKLPFVISCDEQEVNSVKQALNDRTDNVAAIVTSKSISLDNFKLWNTGVNPATLQALWNQFQNIENQLKQTFGITSNENPDKRERLLVDEVNSNNQITEDNLRQRLNQRELFCERVNKNFGLNISVKVREQNENLGIPEPVQRVTDTGDDTASNN